MPYMNTFSFTQSEQTRTELLHFIQNSLNAELWKTNTQAVNALKQSIADHALFQHPMLQKLHQCQLSLEQLKFIHLNYFTAIVKNFTDALSMAIYQACGLEKCPNIDAGKRIAAKIYARYLLSLNLMDELGFNTRKLEKSSAAKSHLVYFLTLLQQLNLDPANHQHTEPEAFALAQFIQKHINSYADLLLILACTELQVIKFSEALRNNMSVYDRLFTEGYYACHGIAEQGSAELANDDNHEDDIWALLTQCYSQENELHFMQLQSEYLELWNHFWSKMQPHAASLETL
jgi:hypothetical protein